MWSKCQDVKEFLKSNQDVNCYQEFRWSLLNFSGLSICQMTINNSSLSSCASLSWDNFNERKYETRELFLGPHPWQLWSILHRQHHQLPQWQGGGDSWGCVQDNHANQSYPNTAFKYSPSLVCHHQQLYWPEVFHSQMPDAVTWNQFDCPRVWPRQDALHLLHGHRGWVRDWGGQWEEVPAWGGQIRVQDVRQGRRAHP